MRPIYTFKQFARSHFGGDIYRVPIDLGAGCPHRAGDGSGGCSFCPLDGARAAQLGAADDIEQQIAKSVDFARRRYGAERFMAYLQTFTNTGSDPSRDRRVFERILKVHPFDAISVGTRPDCLSDATLDMLADLGRETELWLDLGVQTIHARTLRQINRGHSWADSRRAILAAAERGLHPVAHVILGLPAERVQDFNETAAALAELPLSGIKIHNLHVIKGTALAKEYRRQAFKVYDEFGYAEILIGFLRRIPADLPVMRLCTDTPREQIQAPRWTMKKGQFEHHLFRQMELRELRQGDLRGDAEDAELPLSRLDPVETDDGSVTYWNPDFKEHYHSPVGARTEALEKYIRPVGLDVRLARGPVRLLDICFGLGYNALCACEQAGGSDLRIVALEMDRRMVGQAARELSGGEECRFDWPIVLDDIYRNGCSRGNGFRIDMRWGDARHTLRDLDPDSFDIVFLDAFSTQRNSELWTLDFFRALRGPMKPDAVLATYCAALPVRGGLMQAGFHIGESIPVGRKRGGTIAAMRGEDIEHPVSERELEVIRSTTRGLPYRDPRGCWNNGKILRQRELLRQKRKHHAEGT